MTWVKHRYSAMFWAYGDLEYYAKDTADYFGVTVEINKTGGWLSRIYSIKATGHRDNITAYFNELNKRLRT